MILETRGPTLVFGFDHGRELEDVAPAVGHVVGGVPRGQVRDHCACSRRRREWVRGADRGAGGRRGHGVHPEERGVVGGEGVQMHSGRGRG